MNLTILREKVANRLLDLRRLDYIIQSDTLEIISKDHRFTSIISAMIDGASSLDYKIRNSCLETLKDMIQIYEKRDVSIRDLREEARKIYVPKYSRLTKSELLSEITVRKNGRSDQSNSGEIQQDPGSIGIERISPSVMRLQA